MHGMNNKKEQCFFNDDILNLVWNWKWMRPWSLIIIISSSSKSRDGDGCSNSSGGGSSSSGTDSHNTRRHCTCAQWHDCLQSGLFKKM